MTSSAQDQPERGPHQSIGDGSTGAARPCLQVYFKCSGQYHRVFRNARGDLYVARCGKCGQSVRFAVGPGGTDRRFFEVSC